MFTQKHIQADMHKHVTLITNYKYSILNKDFKYLHKYISLIRSIKYEIVYSVNIIHFILHLNSNSKNNINM